MQRLPSNGRRPLIEKRLHAEELVGALTGSFISVTARASLALRLRKVVTLGDCLSPLVPLFGQAIPQFTVFPHSDAQLREVQTWAADCFARWYECCLRVADHNTALHLPKDQTFGALDRGAIATRRQHCQGFRANQWQGTIDPRERARGGRALDAMRNPECKNIFSAAKMLINTEPNHDSNDSFSIIVTCIIIQMTRTFSQQGSTLNDT